ncbi:MAG: hypothetical protein ABIA74_00470 [bacterium]
MDTKMNCCKCDREMSLTEFLTYAEAYLLKFIVPAALPFLISAINQKLSDKTRGIIDESMAGLANNFAIACPNCKAIDCWYPASGKKPKKLKSKNENIIF